MTHRHSMGKRHQIKNVSCAASKYLPERPSENHPRAWAKGSPATMRQVMIPSTKDYPMSEVRGSRVPLVGSTRRLSPTLVLTAARLVVNKKNIAVSVFMGQPVGLCR